MSRYEGLMMEYQHLDIREDYQMPKGLSGIYFDNAILINKKITAYEKTGVLAEEIGHYETTYGDILDLGDVRKKKLEIVARRWGYNKLVSLDKMVECYELGHFTVEDVCIYLEITESYLKNALDFYKNKYGDFCIHNQYLISFDPLNIRVRR